VIGEPAAEPRPAPDPNYILGQAEFHQTVGGLLANIRSESIGLRQFIGWVLATFGCLALLLGLAILYSRDGMDVSRG
jgi:hypothetical protein